MDFNKLNDSYQKIEIALNITSCIPVVKVFGSVGQFSLGKLQIISGLSFSAFYSIKSLFAKTQTDKSEYKTKAIYSLIYVKHGALNIARSFAVLIPMANLILLGKDGYDYLTNKKRYREFSDVQNLELMVIFNKNVQDFKNLIFNNQIINSTKQKIVKNFNDIQVFDNINPFSQFS